MNFIILLRTLSVHEMFVSEGPTRVLKYYCFIVSGKKVLHAYGYKLFLLG